MKWLTSSLLPRQREETCRQKSRGRLRQSENFFSLAYHVVANHVVRPVIWRGSIQNSPGSQTCHRDLRLRVEDVNIVCVANSSRIRKNFLQCKPSLKPKKTSCLNGIRTLDLCHTGTVLFSPSYQANWALVMLLLRNIPVDSVEC